MSDKSTKSDSKALNPADKLASERAIIAQELIERARLPFAMFLVDCLAAVDKEYLTSIVGRFIETKHDPIEANRLYKGLTNVNDDDWMERSSLAEYDMLFLLHFSAFATGTSYVKRLAKGWHPNLDERFNLEPMFRKKLSVLIEWRNIAVHKPRKLKDERRLRSLTRDYAEFLSSCLTTATGDNRNAFSPQTVQLLKDFVRRYEVVETKRIDPKIFAAGVVLIGLLGASLWYHLRSVVKRTTHTLVMLPAETLTPTDQLKLVSELLATTKGADSMRFVVYIDSTSTFMDRTVVNDSQHVRSCVEEMSILSRPMADITKLTAAFHAGYHDMMGLDPAKGPVNLFIIGHLPQLADAQFEELRRSNWQPGNDAEIPANWRKRNFPRPRWVYSRAATDYDREFFRVVMHSGDSTLLPFELPL
ncbi:MAG: hypothetical protein FGM32_10635 [Candidatus Kapabacteria bacterium]|nr:hypothetical protein [Candidatus Kapabacteria bacterium]